MSQLLVEYDKKTGKFLQSLSATNIDQYAKVWKSHGKSCLIVSSPIEISGEKLLPNQCNYLNGKITKRVISQEEIDQEQAAAAFDQFRKKRLFNQPLPIHATKLSIALSGRFELLEEEAALKSMTPEDLADKIIAKASEAMARETEYQAEVEALHAE